MAQWTKPPTASQDLHKPRHLPVSGLGTKKTTEEIVISAVEEKDEETDSKKGLRNTNDAPQASQISFWRVNPTNPPSQPCLEERLVSRMVVVVVWERVVGPIVIFIQELDVGWMRLGPRKGWEWWIVGYYVPMLMKQ